MSSSAKCVTYVEGMVAQSLEGLELLWRCEQKVPYWRPKYLNGLSALRSL